MPLFKNCNLPEGIAPLLCVPTVIFNVTFPPTLDAGKPVNVVVVGALVMVTGTAADMLEVKLLSPA